jgi:uncharacterized protein (DUF58 family)
MSINARTPYTEKIQSVIDAQVFTEEGVTGNVSRVFHESPYLFIVFEDGRWVVFTLVLDRSGTATELYQSTPDLEYLYAAGLLTEQDATDQREHEAQEAAKETEARELAELDRLLAKYGDRKEAEPVDGNGEGVRAR